MVGQGFRFGLGGSNGGFGLIGGTALLNRIGTDYGLDGELKGNSGLGSGSRLDGGGS